MKIIDLLIKNANAKPDNIALRNEHIEISYEKMSSDALYLAEKLKYAGCSEGVQAAILLSDSAEYLISFFAISASGGIIFPLSCHMTPYEISDSLNKAHISIVITDKFFEQKLSNALTYPNSLTIVEVQYKNENLKVETFKFHKPIINEYLNDVALLIQTSGTTSQPKIVMLSDNQLLSNMFVYREVMNFNQPNIVYCSLPFHHIYSISAQLLTHISLGDTLIIKSSPFFIKDFFNAVQTYQITITSFVPYMAMLMAEYPEPSRFNLSSLRYITLAGAKTPKPIYEKLIQSFENIKFINTYGLTEASPRVSIAAPDPNNFPSDSVGKALPGIKIRIVDENGNTLPAGGTGEIEVKGSNVFKGYFNQPQLTEQTKLNGWLKTGDIGTLDAEDNLYIVARKKEIIMCGGENIYPDEIEEILLKNPYINDTAAIGIPNNRLEEVLCVFVVPNNGSCNEADLINFCRKRLSSYKIPRKVFLIDKIPKINSCKINRRLLKNIAIEKLRMEL